MHRGPLESLDEYQSEHVQSKTPQRQSRKTSRETITEKLQDEHFLEFTQDQSGETSLNTWGISRNVRAVPLKWAKLALE